VNLDELLQAGGPERLFRSRSAGSLDWTELRAELLLPLAVRIEGMAHASLIVWIHAVRIHSLTQYPCLHNAMGAEYFCAADNGSSIISFDTVEVHFTTTPEPSPVLLVGSALFVIAAILRRRPDNEI
jgi:hypothetical protein